MSIACIWGALSVGEDEVAEKLLIVTFRKIAPVMRPSAFLTGQGTTDNRLGDIERVSQIESRRPRKVVERTSGAADLGEFCAQFHQFGEGLLKLRLVPDDSGLTPHGFTQSVPQSEHGRSAFPQQRSRVHGPDRSPRPGSVWSCPESCPRQTPRPSAKCRSAPLLPRCRVRP